MHAVEASGAKLDAPQDRVPAWSSTATIPFSVVSPVLVTVATTEIVEPTSTFPLVALVTPIDGWSIVVDECAFPETVTSSWSVPETVTVLVTDVMPEGAENDPVQAVCAAGARVPEPMAHESVPAWESMATMPLRPVSPVLVTVAVTIMVPPTSVLPLVAFVTPMFGWMMVVDALAKLDTVTGV